MKLEQQHDVRRDRGWLDLWPYLLILAIGLAVLMPKLGDFGFWDPWEPKYAESAREMLARDSYIVPYYLDEVRLTKPILVYWGILVGTAVFGMNEFGARIVGVGMALMTMLVTFYAVARLRGRRAGLISALVLGTVPQFYFIARQSMPDVYLFTSVGCALLFLCLALFKPENRRDLHFGLAYACIALAVLAKGPMIVGFMVLVSLSSFALLHLDLQALWQPERRKRTAGIGAAIVALPALAAGLGFVCYLFGTSKGWWSYSDRGQDSAGELRERIAAAFHATHAAEGLLLLVIATVGWAGFKTWRNRGRQNAPWSQSICYATAIAASLWVLFSSNLEFRIFGSTLLALLTCLALLWISVASYLRQPWLWPTAQPLVRDLRRQLLLFAGVFAVVAGPWHIGVFLQEGSGYVSDFIIKHNIHRASEVINRTGSAYWYTRVLVFGYFPWGCFIPVALASLVGWWDKDVLKRYGFELFLLIWSLVTFCMFSASATKFAHYLAPLMVSMCALIGLAIDRTFEHPHARASQLSWLTAAMLFVLPARDLLDGETSDSIEAFTMKSWVPAYLETGPFMQALIVASAMLIGLLILMRSRLLLAGLVACAVTMACYHTAYLIPSLSPHKSLKYICETWKSLAPDGDPPLCFFGDQKHGAYFYTENRIQRMRSREEFEAFLDPQRPAFCIVERESLPTLQQNHRAKYRSRGLQMIDQSHFQYVLISNYTPPGHENTEDP